MLLVKTRGFFFFFRTSAWSVIYANGIRMWLMAGRNAQIICMEQTLIAKLSVWCHSWWLLCWKFLLFVLCSGRFAVITFQGISAKRRIQHLLRGSACNSFPLVNRKDLINLSNCGSLEPRRREILNGGDVDFFISCIYIFTTYQAVLFSSLSLSVCSLDTSCTQISRGRLSMFGWSVCSRGGKSTHILYSRRRTDTRVDRVKVWK